RIVPLGPELEIQIAAVRGLLDGALEIEFFRRPGAREFPQPAQRDLDVAGAELDRVVEIAELAFVPDLHSAETAVALLADAHALGFVAVAAIRRRSGGAAPFRAALVPALLFGEPLAQGFQELVEAAHRLDQLFFLLGEVLLHDFPEPLRGNL